MVRLRPLIPLAILATLAACEPGLEHRPEPLSFGGQELETELAALVPVLTGARIVLLGENGHGVAEFTEAKVALVEWLHREHGFDLLVFESGLFECGEAWRGLVEERLAPPEALRACLRYPFEHAELLPLFESMATGASPELEFAGMDPQAQGFDSGDRPRTSARWLASLDSALAQRVARADSALYLVPQAGGLGDSIYAFAHANRASLLADYRAAGDRTEGLRRWTYRLAEGWVERLAVRGGAAAVSTNPRPPEYYELRDEWMARAVAAHADSMGQPRKVIVWLHNDHARYGRFPVGPDSIRSTGSFLREWYGDEVVSLGLFLGRGTVADNARRPRQVVPMPQDGLEAFLARGVGAGNASYLVLRHNTDPEVASWAAETQTYIRTGLDSLTLVPAREFDALVYIDSVGVPAYGVR